jgi:hypothetical protein
VIFDIDRAKLATVFPATRIVRASREALSGVALRAEDVDFLVDVGLPQGLFQFAPPLAADGEPQKSLMLDLGDADEGVESGELEGVGETILLGGIQDWYLFLRLSDGVIYSFPAEGDDYYQVNGDLSSLATVLYLLEKEYPRTRRTPGVPTGGPSGPSGPSNAEYQRVADLIRAEIEPRDPIPFRVGSLWPHYFMSFVDGLYPEYE